VVAETWADPVGAVRRRGGRTPAPPMTTMATLSRLKPPNPMRPKVDSLANDAGAPKQRREPRRPSPDTTPYA